MIETTGLEGGVAKAETSMYFSDSWPYHFEVILSKFFGSSDLVEILHEISA